MSVFAVVDLSNLFHRARHNGTMVDSETKIALAVHIVFRSLRKMRRDFAVDHIVFAVDQGSWRYRHYPGYKARRKLHRMAATVAEQEENALFFAALDDLSNYLRDQTRCTVLHAEEIEGDDFIARWIQRHPHDQHIIISGDSDFVQLIAPNVRIYDAINQRIIAHTGITDEKGRAMAFSVNPKDGKLKTGAPSNDFIPEEEWWRKALFIKLIRGDAGDSVFAAYPGVRYEGKKFSIRSAWDDRKERGYDWNNLMYQSWDKLTGIDEETGERTVKSVRVVDEFRINESVIDLTQQPASIVQKMDDSIDAAIAHRPSIHVGIGFLRFCTTHDLPALAKEADDHLVYLNASYPIMKELR
jgi:hypothetical protein